MSHHQFVFILCTVRSALIPDQVPEDAPLVVIFDGCPSFKRLVDAICATDNTVKREIIEDKLSKAGLTDNTLAQSLTVLVRARADGHWPSIENRMTDGSLIAMQLLPTHSTKLIPDISHLRRKTKAKEN